MADFLPVIVTDEDAQDVLAQTAKRSKMRSYSSALLLYPSLGAALLAGTLTGIGHKSNQEPGPIGLLFCLFFFGNLAVVTHRLTKKRAIVFGLALSGLLSLVSFSPRLGNFLVAVFDQALFMNTTFYWMWFFLLGSLLFVGLLGSQTQFWTFENGKLIHRRLFQRRRVLGAEKWFYEIDREDLLRRFLLRSGRLILQPLGQGQPIILENVIHIESLDEYLRIHCEPLVRLKDIDDAKHEPETVQGDETQGVSEQADSIPQK